MAGKQVELQEKSGHPIANLIIKHLCDVVERINDLGQPAHIIVLIGPGFIYSIFIGQYIAQVSLIRLLNACSYSYETVDPSG